MYIHIRGAPSLELGAVFGSTPRRSAPAPCTAELAMSSAVQCSTLPAAAKKAFIDRISS